MKCVLSVLGGLAMATLTAPVRAALYDFGRGIYHDALVITWLQNANHAKASGYDSDSLMTSNQAMT